MAEPLHGREDRNFHVDGAFGFGGGRKTRVVERGGAGQARHRSAQRLLALLVAYAAQQLSFPVQADEGAAARFEHGVATLRRHLLAPTRAANGGQRLFGAHHQRGGGGGVDAE